jgi:hypothetical protein
MPGDREIIRAALRKARTLGADVAGVVPAARLIGCPSAVADGYRGPQADRGTYIVLGLYHDPSTPNSISGNRAGELRRPDPREDRQGTRHLAAGGVWNPRPAHSLPDRGRRHLPEGRGVHGGHREDGEKQPRHCPRLRTESPVPCGVGGPGMSRPGPLRRANPPARGARATASAPARWLLFAPGRTAGTVAWRG